MILLMSFMLALSSFAQIQFPANKDCVAWKTRKRMFMFKSVEPVGLNCAVEKEYATGKGFTVFKLTIPIKEFDSQENDRDIEVKKILKADIQPNLIFHSQALTPELVKKIGLKEVKVIRGRLNIAGKDYPVAFEVDQFNEQSMLGHFKSTFSHFSLKPPKVVGGLVAKVYDELELHFHILSPGHTGVPLGTPKSRGQKETKETPQ